MIGYSAWRISLVFLYYPIHTSPLAYACFDIHFRVDNQAHNYNLPTTTFLVPLFNNRRSLPRSLSIDNLFNDHDVQRHVVFGRQGITGTTTTTPNEIRDERGYTIPRRERSVTASILLLKSLSMSETSAMRTVRKEDVERNTVGYTIEIPYVQVQDESTDRGLITITLPNKTKINVTEIHRTANKELFIMHSIAADRSLHDLGFTPKAMKCENIIKKCLVIMKRNYQPEPVQGATLDPDKKEAYDKAMARHDKAVKKRDETVNKMLTTLKSY